MNSGINKAECNEKSKTKELYLSTSIQLNVLVLPTKQMQRWRFQPIVPSEVQKVTPKWQVMRQNLKHACVSADSHFKNIIS